MMTGDFIKMMFDLYERESNRWWNYWISYEEKVSRLQSSYMTVLMDIMMRMFHPSPLRPSSSSPYMISPPLPPDLFEEYMRRQQEEAPVSSTSTVNFQPDTLKDMIDYIVSKRQKKSSTWNSKREDKEGEIDD